MRGGRHGAKRFGCAAALPPAGRVSVQPPTPEMAAAWHHSSASIRPSSLGGWAIRGTARRSIMPSGTGPVQPWAGEAAQARDTDNAAAASTALLPGETLLADIPFMAVPFHSASW